ncbi:MAG: 1-acyl-sn-glycerol-3-phosphate acyltransferase [Erysipelotrichales bacterium]|nr:1-acyl-sn-glycerol-3-phosphate acyltransferase [Erysipelotrichales bacterium]
MFKYIGIVFRIGPLLVWNYFTWILYYYRHKDKYTLEERYKKLRKLDLKLLKRLHVDIDAKGVENLNDKQIKLITPNHQSLLDPLVLIALSEKPISFVAKKEVQKMPIIGKAFKVIDGEFIDRQDLRQQIKFLKIVEKSLLNKEHSWGIFPEGTRNKNIENVLIGEFHPGTFKVALNADVTVLPVVIEGIHKILSKKYWSRRYSVAITFLKSISNKDINAKNTIEYRDFVYNKMCEELKSLKNKRLLQNS